jgi:hypothetical protein
VSHSLLLHHHFDFGYPKDSLFTQAPAARIRPKRTLPGDLPSRCVFSVSWVNVRPTSAARLDIGPRTSAMKIKLSDNS